MFRKSWNSQGEIYGQSAPVASALPEPQKKPISSIGFWIIGIVFLRALWSGHVVMHNAKIAGHTQVDMDRDLARWEKASKTYQQSVDCGSLKGEPCRDHWRKEVAPNLKTVEVAWGAFNDQIQYEFAHESVPNTCRAAFAEFKTAMDAYYPVEDQVVSAVSNNALTGLDDLTARESAAHDTVIRVSDIEARECKGY